MSYGAWSAAGMLHHGFSVGDNQLYLDDEDTEIKSHPSNDTPNFLINVLVFHGWNPKGEMLLCTKHTATGMRQDG